MKSLIFAILLGSLVLRNKCATKHYTHRVFSNIASKNCLSETIIIMKKIKYKDMNDKDCEIVVQRFSLIDNVY